MDIESERDEQNQSYRGAICFCARVEPRRPPLQEVFIHAPFKAESSSGEGEAVWIPWVRWIRDEVRKTPAWTAATFCFNRGFSETEICRDGSLLQQNGATAGNLLRETVERIGRPGRNSFLQGRRNTQLMPDSK